MEQHIEIETFESSLLTNIWVERHFIILLTVAISMGVYAHLTSFQLLEEVLGMFLFTGIVFLGFVAIAAHIKYYFRFERRRKVELYADKIVIKMNDQLIDQILKNDIIRIILYGKRHINVGNFFPVVLDSFYYLVLIGKNQEKIILTCLLDIKLKRKIADWYGKEPEHIYQFFPFPNSEYV